MIPLPPLTHAKNKRRYPYSPYSGSHIKDGNSYNFPLENYIKFNEQIDSDENVEIPIAFRICCGMGSGAYTSKASLSKWTRVESSRVKTSSDFSSSTDFRTTEHPFFPLVCNFRYTKESKMRMVVVAEPSRAGEWRVGKFWWFFGRKCLPPFSQRTSSRVDSHMDLVEKWVGRDNGRPRVGIPFNSRANRARARRHTEPRRNRFTTPSSWGLLLPTPKIKCAEQKSNHHCTSISWHLWEKRGISLQRFTV